MRRFAVGLAVLVGAVMVFMAGTVFAAVDWAFLWPSQWGKQSDDFRYGYMSGVIDTVIQTQAGGVPGMKLTSAYNCARNTKGLNVGQVAQATAAQFGSNPQNTDTVAAAVIAALDACKFPAQSGGKNTAGRDTASNTLQRRP